MNLHINPFRCGTEKEAALKPLEEASEAREAWQRLDRAMELNANDTLVGFASVDLAYELADCVTACANLADRYGLDLQAALDRVEKHNRERGRYE